MDINKHMAGSWREEAAEGKNAELQVPMTSWENQNVL